MGEDSGLPEWFEDLIAQYQAGVAREFVIFGNTADLIPNPDKDSEPDKPYILPQRFFEKVFDEREMVVFFSMAQGLRFLNREVMEPKFRKKVGLDRGNDKDDAASASPFEKAGVIKKKEKEIPRDPETCLVLLERVLRGMKGTAVVLNFAHHIAPVGGPGGGIVSPTDKINIETLTHWANSEEIRNNGGIIILVTDHIAGLSSELRQGSNIKTIMVPKPEKKDREAFLRAITEGGEDFEKLRKELGQLRSKLKTAPKKKQPQIEAGIEECKRKFAAFPNLFLTPSDFDFNAFSIATQGMSYQQILEMFLRGRESGGEITLEYAKERKREILNTEYGEYLEIIEPIMGLEDIGGLEYVKERFTMILKALECGNHLLVPMGITLMGPPGTGKTVLVEALAKEAGFNFVKTKNLRSMFVGESEARMQTMVYALRSLFPVVVMNDEAEQMESSRDSYSGDSGVSNRMRKMWMEFLSDTKIQGKILVINCTNRPDLIDVALKRSGRSDDRIPLILPSLEERKKIFSVLFRYLKVPTDITDFSRAAELTDERSGADIKKMIEESNRFAFRQGKNKVDDMILAEAIEDFLPSASQAEIDRMTIMALKECSSKSLLPPQSNEIIQKIKARNLVKVDETIERILNNNSHHS